MQFASNDYQQPSLTRAKTALLPSRCGDVGNDEERQPLLGRRNTAPPVMSKAARNRAILDRQLSRRVSWMVNIEAIHDDDDELDDTMADKEAIVNKSHKASVKEEENAAALDAGLGAPTTEYMDVAKPEIPVYGLDDFDIDDFGPEEFFFRTPKLTKHLIPLLILDAIIIGMVAVLTMVAQPLLRQMSSSYISALLSAPEGAVSVGIVMLMMVNGFMFLSPGYFKTGSEKVKGLDNATLKSIYVKHGFERWCRVCAAPKISRMHHCSMCNRCVAVMDHHCGLGNCVGQQNHRFWMALVTYSGIFALHAVLVIAATFISHWPGIGHAAAVATATGANLKTASFIVLFFFGALALMYLISWQGFFRFHLKLILDNFTTIEYLEECQEYAKTKSTFDQGGRKQNVASFFSATRNVPWPETRTHRRLAS